MFGRLHAFGDDGAAERGGKADDAFDDRQILGIPQHVAHKALVDLEHAGGQAAQVGQRRVAGAEVIEREANAELIEWQDTGLKQQKR